MGVRGWVHGGCTGRSADGRAGTQRRMGAAARKDAGMVHVGQGERIGAIRRLSRYANVQAYCAVDNVRPPAWPSEECGPAYGYASQRASGHPIACAINQMGGTCGLLHSRLGCPAVAARRHAGRGGGGEYCCGQRHLWAPVPGPVDAGAVIGADHGRDSSSRGLSRL